MTVRKKFVRTLFFINIFCVRFHFLHTCCNIWRKTGVYDFTLKLCIYWYAKISFSNYKNEDTVLKTKKHTRMSCLDLTLNESAFGGEGE